MTHLLAEVLYIAKIIYKRESRLSTTLFTKGVKVGVEAAMENFNKYLNVIPCEFYPDNIRWRLNYGRTRNN